MPGIQQKHGDLIILVVKILQYLVKVVIKPRIFSPVVRQPALPWQPFCAALAGGIVLMLAPTMKLIGPPGTQLWHMVYSVLRSDVSGQCACVHFLSAIIDHKQRYKRGR